jgi:hypothetical protein
MADLTVRIDTLVVELAPAEHAAVLAGATDQLRAAIEAAVLSHPAVRTRLRTSRTG